MSYPCLRNVSSAAVKPSSQATALDQKSSATLRCDNAAPHQGLSGSWLRALSGANLAASSLTRHVTLARYRPSNGVARRGRERSSGTIVCSVHAAHCGSDRSDCSPAESAAVTAIPGAVSSGSVDGYLRAYSTETGEEFDTEHDFPTVPILPMVAGSTWAGRPWFTEWSL